MRVTSRYTVEIGEWSCSCGESIGTVHESYDFQAAATFALNLWRRGDWDDHSVVTVESGDVRRSFEVHWSSRIRDWCVTAVTT